MKAILLAAGVGRRLRAALPQGPKCLLAFRGRTLVERLLAGLDAAGVAEAVIVVGFQRQAIESKIGTAWGRMPVSYVVNPDYEKGAILSLWAAREHFTDDLLIMDADVFCPGEMIARLVRSSHRNCFLLDGRVQGSGEEMMLMARDGRVLDIGRGVKPGYDIFGESVGFLKVARPAVPDLLAALRQRLEAGYDRSEHEEAYPFFLQRQVAGFERVDDLPWAEIDFPEDVAHVDRELVPLVDGS